MITYLFILLNFYQCLDRKIGYLSLTLGCHYKALISKKLMTI